MDYRNDFFYLLYECPMCCKDWIFLFLEEKDEIMNTYKCSNCKFKFMYNKYNNKIYVRS